MIRKVSCLLILFSFLLVKTEPLYAIAFNHLNMELVADQQGKEIPEGDTKGEERAGMLDEDLADQSGLTVPIVVFAKPFPLFAFPNTVKVYTTLSNPPPDTLA
jgi:hypothetical protein